jgi:hypothetical protein
LLERQRARAAHSGRLFLLTYKALAQRSVVAGTFLFKIRPKHHDYDHVVWMLERGSLLNPRCLTCFAEEDLMGRMKKLGLKCPKQAAPLRILEKWLLQAHRRWSGLTQDWVSVGRSAAKHAKTSRPGQRVLSIRAPMVGGFRVGNFGLV